MQHENQRIESVSRFFCESAKLLGLLVDLIGIEPMTSSMPWKRAPSCATGPQSVGQLSYSRRLREIRQTCHSGARQSSQLPCHPMHNEFEPHLKTSIVVREHLLSRSIGQRMRIPMDPLISALEVILRIRLV